MDVSDLLAITLRDKLKIKAAKWGTPKKIFRKKKNVLHKILKNLKAMMQSVINNDAIRFWQ
jgi:hypothetical protein